MERERCAANDDDTKLTAETRHNPAECESVRLKTHRRVFSGHHRESSVGHSGGGRPFPRILATTEWVAKGARKREQKRRRNVAKKCRNLGEGDGDNHRNGREVGG